MSNFFKRVIGLPYVGGLLYKCLVAAFDPTSGHSHDGVDSKALSGGTADDSTLALANGVFSIKSGGVTPTELAANAVETAAIKDSAVVAAKLATDAVETAKIKNAAVAIAKLDTPLQALVLGVAGSYKVARGVTAVTGTADVTTGLATVVAFAATLAEDPSADATIATGVIPAQSGGTAGHLTVKVWKPTAADNSAPTAGLVEKSVSWIAIGT